MSAIAGHEERGTNINYVVLVSFIIRFIILLGLQMGTGSHFATNSYRLTNIEIRPGNEVM